MNRRGGGGNLVTEGGGGGQISTTLGLGSMVLKLTKQLGHI